MKVRLVIEGNVQGAGYGAMVKNVARRLRIKGLVRNLDDGNVEVFCECDENVLKKFINMIDRKGDPEQPFSLNVEKISVYKDGDANFVGSPEEFGLFETDYKIEIDAAHKESLERSEIGILVLSSMHQDLKEGQDDLKEGQKAMHQDMNKSFKESDENINKNFNQLNETIGTKFESMDVKYGDISKTMREMHNDMKEMKDLFAKLVNHIVKE